MERILLESKREKFAYNNDKFLSVGLDSDHGLLPISDVSDNINEYEQYFSEHDASNKYRITFSINPVCSNVLFNNVTEIVYKEGSDDCVFFGVGGAISKKEEPIPDSIQSYNSLTGRLVKPYDRYNLIRDTAYSAKEIGPLVYHCGYDIFNNHTLRSKEFIIVNKSMEKEKDFNTLSDYMRDNNGNIVIDKKITNNKDNSIHVKEFKRHLYTTDTILSYTQAIDENLSEENGWIGFRNPVTFNIHNIELNGKKITANRCMNNNKPGEFIDMYPDRSLYSFIPKYNKYRKRNENNWEFCLTYPYSSTTNEIVTDQNNQYNGLICSMVASKNITLNDINKIILFKTTTKHNLNVGNKIKLAIMYKNEYKETKDTITIQSIGKGGYEGDYYFGLKYNDILPILGLELDQNNILSSNEIQDIHFRFVKFINGGRCKYYFRKFRKIPNFRGLNVLNEDITESDIINAIRDKKQIFSANLNKIAFSENIYSDKLAEIVFNEDINVSGLKDNLGRDLSEIYLTIIKTNYGHEKWYEKSNYWDADIEFSHCFGKITSGIDMYNDAFDYNIHRLHNINGANRPEYIPKTPMSLEDDITIYNDDFMGDLVEFSPYNVNETVIEDVLHRFNTAQRECQSDEYKDIMYDDIISDDFDVYDNNGFEVKIKPYCSQKDIKGTVNENPCNLMPEGYFYKPHYRIKLREFSNEVQGGRHQLVSFAYDDNNGIKDTAIDGKIYEITTSLNYFIQLFDKIHIIDKRTNVRYIGTVTKIYGDNFNIIQFKASLPDDALTKYSIFRLNELMPSFAYELEDGSGRYLWRSFKSITDIEKDSELYNRPFTNGAHYIYEGINFYLRRQDPFSIYGLSIGVEDVETPISLINLVIEGNNKDVDKFDYMENNGDIC